MKFPIYLKNDYDDWYVIFFSEENSIDISFHKNQLEEIHTDIFQEKEYKINLNRQLIENKVNYKPFKLQELIDKGIDIDAINKLFKVDIRG